MHGIWTNGWIDGRDTNIFVCPPGRLFFIWIARSNEPAPPHFLHFPPFLPHIFKIKRLHWKELTSRLVGASIIGLEALSLSVLKMAGTTADKKMKKTKIVNFFPFLHVVMNINR